MYMMGHEDSAKPKGELPVQYEVAPISFVVEQAGGAASTGTRRAMEVAPGRLHQRVPIFIGSKTEVAWADEFIAGKRA
jgi:fructose-1,6-bisphosphatase I